MGRAGRAGGQDGRDGRDGWDRGTGGWAGRRSSGNTGATCSWPPFYLDSYILIKSLHDLISNLDNSNLIDVFIATLK